MSAVPQTTPPPKRDIAWFSATVAVISALASIGSMLIAWKAVDAYPDQLLSAERLETCSEIHTLSMRMGSAAGRLEHALANGPDAENAVARIEELGEIQTGVSAASVRIRMLGPESLRASVVRLQEAQHAFITMAEDGISGVALTQSAADMGLRLRDFGSECQRSIR